MRNDDRLFPEFRGQDLASRGGAALDAFLARLPIRPVLLGNVYDPSFGDDARNFLRVDPRVARTNHRRMNETLAQTAGRYGTLVDLHGHFLTGDPSWFARTIEPSLSGASEVRRAFWGHLGPERSRRRPTG